MPQWWGAVCHLIVRPGAPAGVLYPLYKETGAVSGAREAGTFATAMVPVVAAGNAKSAPAYDTVSRKTKTFFFWEEEEEGDAGAAGRADDAGAASDAAGLVGKGAVSDAAVGGEGAGDEPEIPL